MDEQQRYEAFMARLVADRAAGVVVPLTTDEQVKRLDDLKQRVHAEMVRRGMRKAEGA